jgi:hypothetical protein
LKYKKGEKGQIKRKCLTKKAIKEEELKIKVLAHELLASTLSLVIVQSFQSLFIESSNVKFDLPMPLVSLPVRLITLLHIGASNDVAQVL